MELQDLNKQLNGIREVITEIQKEVNESGASVANLRDNIRARKLVKEIGEVQAEIDSHDIEEMARARRNFDEKYKLAKEKEDNLRVEVCYIYMSLRSGQVADRPHHTRSLSLLPANRFCFTSLR